MMTTTRFVISLGLAIAFLSTFTLDASPANETVGAKTNSNRSYAEKCPDVLMFRLGKMFYYSVVECPGSGTTSGLLIYSKLVDEGCNGNECNTNESGSYLPDPTGSGSTSAAIGSKLDPKARIMQPVFPTSGSLSITGSPTDVAVGTDVYRVFDLAFKKSGTSREKTVRIGVQVDKQVLAAMPVATIQNNVLSYNSKSFAVVKN